MMNRVLLVDDEESILSALRRIVTRCGWEPLTARSGSEALGLLEQADALVTDAHEARFHPGGRP
jgi:CheY-like chemotaxis protein